MACSSKGTECVRFEFKFLFCQCVKLFHFVNFKFTQVNSIVSAEVLCAQVAILRDALVDDLRREEKRKKQRGSQNLKEARVTLNYGSNEKI